MISHKIKNITILALFVLLLISGGLNLYQSSLRKNDRIRADLDLANSNTLIAQKMGEISIRDSLISTIRRERQIIRSKDSVQLAGLKTRVVVLQAKLSNLPKTVPYSPDSATVDSLRVAFVLKDSVIDTQQLMIMAMEVEKTGIINSFYKEISQLEDQREAQVDISNQLQNQLVEEQGKTRKAERWRKFWKRTTGAVVVAAAAVVTIVTLKE